MDVQKGRRRKSENGSCAVRAAVWGVSKFIHRPQIGSYSPVSSYDETWPTNKIAYVMLTGLLVNQCARKYKEQRKYNMLWTRKTNNKSNRRIRIKFLVAKIRSIEIRAISWKSKDQYPRVKMTRTPNGDDTNGRATSHHFAAK